MARAADVETSNDDENADNVENAVEEMEEEVVMPPLSSYLTGWKFWCAFAVWPVVFLLFNGIVFATLVVFDEYEYRNRHYQTYYGGSTNNSYLAVLRYNASVFAVMLVLDAIVFYRSYVFLEKEIRELDLLTELEEEEEEESSSYRVIHVHAQVSRKMDVFLGRGPRRPPEASIFLSLLILATVGCAAAGLSWIAVWSFSFSPKAQTVCVSMFDEGRRIDNTTKKAIDGVPSDLQLWANSWREHSYQSSACLIHMTDKTTYFAATDPRNTSDNQSDQDERMWYGVPQKLTSTRSDGSIQFFSKVNQPRQCTSLKGIDDLNSESFCCFYDEASSQNGRGGSVIHMPFPPTAALFCVDASEDVSSGVLRNVTFNRAKHQRDGEITADSSSATLHADKLWVQLVMNQYDNRMGTHKKILEFYTLTSGTMLLNSIINVTVPDGDMFGFQHVVGRDSPCSFWIRFIENTMRCIVLVPASFWLLKVRRMPAGVVPACVAGFMLLVLIKEDLALGLGCMAIGAAIIALLGLMPTSLSVGREELVWILYTMSTSVFVLTVNRQYQFLLAVVPCAIVGILLDHPVLCLAGWIGGVCSACFGVFNLFLHRYEAGLIFLCVGIFGGPGVVTVGYNLAKYRAYVLYYLKRAWRAMSTVIRDGTPDANRSTRRPAHGPTVHADSPNNDRSGPVRGANDSDLTTSLLDRRS